MKTRIKIVFMLLCLCFFLITVWGVYSLDRQIKQAKRNKQDVGHGYTTP